VEAKIPQTIGSPILYSGIVVPTAEREHDGSLTHSSGFAVNPRSTDPAVCDRSQTKQIVSCGNVVELPVSRPCRRPDDGFGWRP